MKDTTKRILKIIGGVALIAVALIPTPDDVTIISPIAQGLLGIWLISRRK